MLAKGSRLRLRRVVRPPAYLDLRAAARAAHPDRPQQAAAIDAQHAALDLVGGEHAVSDGRQIVKAASCNFLA